MTGEALQGAHQVAALDVPVFPVWTVVDGVCTCPEGVKCRDPGKHPIVAGWQKQATTKLTRIDALAKRHPECNWGVIGLLMIDVDPRNGGSRMDLPPLPRTGYVVRTGGGGWHLGYVVDGQPIPTTKPQAGVDIKGPKSFVVCPGSMHASGVRYQWEWRPGRRIDIGVWPDVWPWPQQETFKPTSGVVRGSFGDTAYGLAALKDEAGKLASTPEGERNNQLNEAALKLAHLVAGGHLTKTTVEPALLDAAHACGLDLRKASATFRSGYNAGIKEPRGPKASTTSRTTSSDARSSELVLVTASTIKPRPVRFLWSERIPVKGLTLLAGQQGDGKSTLSLELAAQASTGRLEGEHHGDPVGSLFMTTEDDWESVIVPRLIAAGADLDLIHGVYVARDRQQTGLVLPSDAEILAAAFEQTEAQLSVIDPLLGHIGHGVDTHKDQHVRQVTTELDAIAQAHSASVLGIVHFTKAVEVKDILYRVMGSQGLTAAARSVLGVFKDESAPKSARLLVHIKSNWSAHAESLGFAIEQAPAFSNEDGESIHPSRLAWSGPRPDVDRFNVLSLSQSEITPEQSEVLTILAEEGPLAPAEVHARRKGAAGRTDSATRHLLGKLLDRGLVQVDERHRYEVVEGSNAALW